MSLRNRSYEKELLDGDDIPHNDLQRNLHELNVLNTLLGGHNITCKGVDRFLNKIPDTQPLTIAEIGCGGGDNLFAIKNYLDRKQRQYSLTGIDIKPDCINYARSIAADELQWICSDYRTVQWPGNKPDVIFSSLFCHHFTDDELVEQLQWLKANSGLGFFINDLHRHAVAYRFIKIATMLFSRSYLVKNDAPLSVKRGFKKDDWVKILSGAGITVHRIKWQWAFRYLICVENE